MAQVIGQKYRVSIDTSPESTATYATFQHEVTCNLALTAEKIEAVSKDTGKHKAYIKTLLDSTITLTAQEDHAPTGTNLSYADVFALWTKNHTDTYKGQRKMKLATAENGGSSITFEGLIMSVSAPYDNNGLVTYDIEFQINTLPVLAAVSA
ncbi:MAG: hypothetical protein NXI00_20015 [Cytophagales bacterium]|nr:hypothetical protein [Cytophagales bacterium]